jgi:hypothetical protein
LVLEKANGFRNLLYRFAEWVGEYPLRLRGSPPKELADLLHARVAEPAFGSYRFVVRFASPQQEDLFDARPINPSAITETLFRFVNIVNERNGDALAELVPDAAYRAALLQLTRNVAPGGKRVREIGIYRHGPDHENAVYLTRATLKGIQEVMPQKHAEKAAWSTVRGTLRALHLDQNWLEISLPDGSTKKCRTVPDMLDDVVGPMVNHEVVVRGPEKRVAGGVRRVVVEEIELAEDT